MIDSARARTVGSSSATSTAGGVGFFLRVLVTCQPLSPRGQQQNGSPRCANRDHFSKSAQMGFNADEVPRFYLISRTADRLGLVLAHGANQPGPVPYLGIRVSTRAPLRALRAR